MRPSRSAGLVLVLVMFGAAVLAPAAGGCGTAAGEPLPPFRDPALDPDERARDLLGRLTLDEKVGFMVHETPGVARLGIPPYTWWNECLHGVARAGRATVFPQAIGLAATFEIGRASCRERV